MERSPHVLLVGKGAMAFCREAGLDFAERDYFFTEARWQALAETIAQDGGAIDTGQIAPPWHGRRGGARP